MLSIPWGALQIASNFGRDFTSNKYKAHDGAVGKWFARYIEASGLKAGERKLVFRSLRHSFDTHLQRAGAQEAAVANLVGHQRTGVTAVDYMHGFFEKGLQEVVELLDYEIPHHTSCGRARASAERPRVERSGAAEAEAPT